jgi:hypothetical protein
MGTKLSVREAKEESEREGPERVNHEGKGKARETQK